MASKMKFETHLSRTLGLFSVTMIGVGAMIGAGIFVLTGMAAGAAGPGLILAFILNGFIALLTAMVYAELGSCFPDAGGGYLWVKEGLPQPMGFLSGWMSWFAHAVACSLYALGFGAYFKEVFSEIGLNVFGLHPDVLVKILAVGMIAIFTYINYRGASETGAAGNIVTALKIVIIGLFIIFGLKRIFETPASGAHFIPFLPKGYSGVFIAMGLTYIAFEGYEIIAQCAEEVIDYKRNIPRAIFLSLIIVVPIYVLVAIVALGAIKGGGMPTWEYLGSHKETAMVEAARQFMPFGALLLLVGGLFSTMSALNATVYSSSRVSFAMARDHNLPSFLGLVHSVQRTPHTAIIASGIIIAAMAVALPIEDVASAADIMFLLLFLLVNFTVIKLRRNRPDLDRYFKVPLLPYIPVLAIILQLFLALYMFKMSPVAWYTVVGWMGFGILFYFFYSQPKETQVVRTPVVFEEKELEQKEYHILVALSKRDEVEPLMTVGSAIAKAHDGDISALGVVEVPEQLPLSQGSRFIAGTRHVLEIADKYGIDHNVPVHVKVRVTHRTHQAIMDTIREEKSKLLVMGWKGYTFRRDKLLGSTLDPLTKDAPCDIAVVKLREIDTIDSIFVPTAGGPHAKFAFELGYELASYLGARLTISTVVPTNASEDRRSHAETLLEQVVSGDREGAPDIVLKVLSSDSIAAALIKESALHSLTLIGASNQSLWEQLRLGSIPEIVSRRSPRSVVIVRKYEGPVKTWIRRFLSG